MVNPINPTGANDLPSPNTDSTEEAAASTQDPLGYNDTIETIGGVQILTSGSTPVSIMDYVKETGSSLTDFFNMLIKNKAGDNYISILKALSGLIGNVPSPAQVQQTYAYSASILNTANGLANGVNGYNQGLQDTGDLLNSYGNAINSDYQQLQNSGASTAYTQQQQQIQDLIAQFQTGYPAGTMTQASFVSQLNAIIGNGQSSYNAQTGAYNNAASNYNGYLAQVNGYNSQVANAPSQVDYDNSINAIDSANVTNAQLNNIYPELPNLPNTIINTTGLSPTTTSIPSGAYDQLDWPDASTFVFTSVDGDGNPVVDSNALNQYMASVSSSYATALNNSSAMNSSLNNFLTQDFQTQQAQLAPSQDPIALLTVPTLTEFSSNILQNLIKEVTAELSQNLANFSNIKLTDPSRDSTSAKDQKILNEIKLRAATVIPQVGLASIGTAALVDVGGLSSYSSITKSFSSQQSAAASDSKVNPEFSSTAYAARKAMGDYLQSVIGASSVLASVSAFEDACNFATTPPPAVTSSLVSLNDLEQFNSLSGTDTSNAVSQIVNKAAADISDEESAALKNEATIPYAVTQQAMTSTLIGRMVSDPSSYTAIHLSNFSQSVFDAVGQNQQLTAAQQLDISKAQASLVNQLSEANVSFSFLGQNPSTTTASVGSALQNAAADLSAQGYQLTPAQLASIQSSFLAGLKTDSGSPIAGGAQSVGSVSNLLARAISESNLEDIPPNAISNSVILHFVQNEDAYRVQTKNLFELNEKLSQAQADKFTDRLQEHSLGKSFHESVQSLAHTDAVNENHFAENLVRVADQSHKNILGSKALETTPQLATQFIQQAIIERNDSAVLSPMVHIHPQSPV